MTNSGPPTRVARLSHGLIVNIIAAPYVMAAASATGITVIMTMSPTRVVSDEAMDSRPPAVRSRPANPRGSWMRSVTAVRRS